ncbi:uncharacterized protein LOC124435643 isoform X2 [Xenia sp. Carnegie-2017]|uniref:uncharacterized protein LOC124435643 isoform X2 n=1 Tax=Xenia sp. Carnegie-2017 TaxID=2897299 RepID=UPI001F03B49A|nr:uncharacterized protein LOC124435643 isoform X2 [Xenia sp. Carnegie-2017]
MKDELSASGVFVLAMFGIMVLFLTFCGFFTFRHCCYVWQRKIGRRRKDSLESILNLLYNEDYYYLESSTPYLAPSESKYDRISDDEEKEDSSHQSSVPSFAYEPSQGQRIKWTGTGQIVLDKYKVCPQMVNSDISSQRKLHRQTKFVGSADDVSNWIQNGTDEPIKPSSTLLPSGKHLRSPPNSLILSHSNSSSTERSPTESRLSPTGNHKEKTVSIKKIVAASKFIGAAHRARRQLRMQSRYNPETFRYRNDSSERSAASSFEKRSSPNADGENLRQSTKQGQINFLEVINKIRDQNLERNSNELTERQDELKEWGSSPRDYGNNDRAVNEVSRDITRDTLSGKDVHMKWVELKKNDPLKTPAGLRPESPRDTVFNGDKSRREKRVRMLKPCDRTFENISQYTRKPGKKIYSASVGGNEKRTTNDVEKLYEKYEEMEKTRYAEMLKKAKSLKR